MGLVQSWNDAGEGYITSQTKTSRQYEVEQDGSFQKFNETSTTITTEWYGLSLNAALEATDAQSQPAENEASYSYTASLQNESIKSYKLVRVYNKKTTVQI